MARLCAPCGSRRAAPPWFWPPWRRVSCWVPWAWGCCGGGPQPSVDCTRHCAPQSLRVRDCRQLFGWEAGRSKWRAFSGRDEDGGIHASSAGETGASTALAGKAKGTTRPGKNLRNGPRTGRLTEGGSGGLFGYGLLFGLRFRFDLNSRREFPGSHPALSPALFQAVGTSFISVA